MNARALGVVWLLTCASCTSVEIVPNDGGGGPIAGSPSSGGFDAVGGSGEGGLGGAPTAGSPEPGPVPGCEALELVGEPVLLFNDGPPIDTHVSLAALPSGQVGLAYLNGWADGAELRSRTIGDAFVAWPPSVSDIAVQYEGSVASHVAISSHLPNGLFTLTAGVRGIYSFSTPGAVRADTDWVQTFLEPTPGTPFDVERFGSGPSSYVLDTYDSIDAPVPSNSFELPPSSCHTMRLATGDGGQLFSMASDYYCDDPPRVDFLRKGSGGIELVASIDLPVAPEQQSLAPRPGGYWYFTSSSSEGIGSHAYPLDASGQLAGEPWNDPFTYGDFSPQFLPWRDGFVGTHREDGEMSLFVSDGFNRTDSLPIPGLGVSSIASASPLAMALGGDDSSSVLVAYPIIDGIALARLDCVTPIK